MECRNPASKLQFSVQVFKRLFGQFNGRQDSKTLTLSPLSPWNPLSPFGRKYTNVVGNLRHLRVYKEAVGLFGVYRRPWKMHCYLSFHSLSWRSRRTRWASEALVALQEESTLMFQELETPGTSHVLPELSNSPR